MDFRPSQERGLVGEVGLEPTVSCSQSTCVANYATPRGAGNHTAGSERPCAIRLVLMVKRTAGPQRPAVRREVGGGLSRARAYDRVDAR